MNQLQADLICTKLIVFRLVCSVYNCSLAFKSVSILLVQFIKLSFKHTVDLTLLPDLIQIKAQALITIDKMKFRKQQERPHLSVSPKPLKSVVQPRTDKNIKKHGSGIHFQFPKRDHHIFAVKKSLEELESHQKETFRKRLKSSYVVNNNATIQTNSQYIYSESSANSDCAYVQKGVLTPKQVEEIIKTTPAQLPQLDDDLADYLIKFSQNNNGKDRNKSECISSIRRENCSQASASRRNISHTALSTEKLATKKLSYGVDLIIKNNNLEYTCQKDKSLEDNTKALEEYHFKVVKEMKYILWSLMKKLVSIGITTIKFRGYFDICDMKLGYVTRITRSEEFVIPSTLTDIDILLETLTVMLLLSSVVRSSVTIINEAEHPNLRSKLKTPYSHINNSLQTAITKNISAITPEDNTNFRFKSIFPKNK
ncbi:hypothetical protein K501DRAFT_329674 [Backusella circina FSU 941]|nr:hypothetical protein K501DRAFT_329674 [Backusella circina FSU 941]